MNRIFFVSIMGSFGDMRGDRLRRCWWELSERRGLRGQGSKVECKGRKNEKERGEKRIRLMLRLMYGADSKVLFRAKSARASW